MDEVDEEERRKKGRNEGGGGEYLSCGRLGQDVLKKHETDEESGDLC